MRKILKGNYFNNPLLSICQKVYCSLFRDLMQENQGLRSLLRGLSSFIGEGAGGILPKLGWDINDFENFINRAETDTAWESFQRHKREKQVNQVAAPTSQIASSSRKRSVDESVAAGRSKRQRPFEEDERDTDYSILAPPSGTVPPNGFSRATASDQVMFNEIIRPTNGSQMFINSPASQPQFSGQSPSNLPFVQSGQTQQYVHSMGLESSVGSVSVGSANAPLLPPSRYNQPSRDSPEVEDISDPKRDEASKLIQ
jgi:hypothetical protein